jgi:hypothetical protein
MQTLDSLGEILAGLMHLRTLDVGMSNETQDITKTIIQPTPPLTHCRVGEECQLELSTRTSEGLPLAHGGLLMTVMRTDDSSVLCECDDQMDGTYTCLFPRTWTSRQAEFEFLLAVDGEEFVPLRTLIDPTTGSETTVESYSRLAVMVPPIECTQGDSLPNADGSDCICATGFFRDEREGGWSCEHCIRGQEPIDQGARCQSCPFGTFSATGQSCEVCPAGQEPNQDRGADDCILCDEYSRSVPGKKCERCPTEQVADGSRTRCVCPRDTYNTTGGLKKSLMQCIGKQHQGDVENVATEKTCSPCGGLNCIRCGVNGQVITPGYARSSEDTPTPQFVFECPGGVDACTNDGLSRCRAGHTGVLCNECKQGYGMQDQSCEKCGAVSSSPVLTLIVVLSVVIGAGLSYYMCCVRTTVEDGDPPALQTQLTHNPLGTDALQSGSSEARLSFTGSTVQSSEDAIMLARACYQPARILVGYVQVISQIGLVLAFELPPMIQSILTKLAPFALNLKSIFQLDWCVQLPAVCL